MDHKPDSTPSIATLFKQAANKISKSPWAQILITTGIIVVCATVILNILAINIPVGFIFIGLFFICGALAIADIN